jgi:hypothetical protein
MVVLTNVGDVAVSIGSIGTTGDFAETNDCGSSLTPGAECKVSVTFTPEKEGARRGHLAFAHNGSGPQGIPLTGMGVPRS